MNQVHRERLLRLADFLDTLPPDRFDYTTWVGMGWEGKADLSCGTTACALGWACAMSEFQALGLRLQWLPRASWMPRSAVVTIDSIGPDDDCWTPVQRATASVFGLSPEETMFLFTPSEYGPDGDERVGGDGKPFEHAKPHEVAEHIRRFVAASGASSGSTGTGDP